MASRLVPKLDYDCQPRRGVLRSGWLHLAPVTVPVALLLSVHALYLVEWAANGERPIPPHRGAGSPVEGVLYSRTWALLLLLFPAAVVQAVVIIGAVVEGALSAGGPSPRPQAFQAFVVLFAPLTCWLLGVVLLANDPWWAMSFFMD